jgi:RNA polymerase sigma-70 factor (ECF subfamily)
MPVPLYSESDVLKELTQGSESAFRQLYERYWFNLYKTIKRYTKSTEVAEDIVQEVFATLWNHRAGFLQVSNLEYYLVTMAKNLTYRTLRKMAAEEIFKINMVENVVDKVADSAALVIDEPYDQLIQQAVGLLPAQQKQVFQLAKGEGMSHKDIAGQLNISHLTVKTHMAKALRFIRHYLQPHLGHYVICIALLKNIF